MKFINKKSAALIAAAIVTFTMTGCTAVKTYDYKQPDEIEGGTDIPDDNDAGLVVPEDPEQEQPGGSAAPENPGDDNSDAVPKPKTVSYITTTVNGVNIRSGAGTGYASRGAAEKNTLYALDGEDNGWFKTGYKNKISYISSKYCQSVEMTASENESIERVIAEGTKLLGTVYVFGAIRYHDGNGKRLSGFTASEFDCSSLMQYIFSKGAGINLKLTTRTQIYQGKTVTRSQLKRGDLMFFTNESRKDNVGVERVGHVALYLGDNWILHTASDYAKIEQISAKRWSYFIQGQRVF